MTPISRVLKEQPLKEAPHWDVSFQQESGIFEKVFLTRNRICWYINPILFRFQDYEQYISVLSKLLSLSFCYKRGIDQEGMQTYSAQL